MKRFLSLQVASVMFFAYLAVSVYSNRSGHPDRKITFDSNRDGNEEIYVINADGSNVQRLTHAKRKDEGNWFPAWSPDGSKIVFTSNRGADREFNNYIMSADGTSVRGVTQDVNIKSGDLPAWSPDAKRIVFHSPAGKIGDLYVIDVEGTNLRRLTKTDGSTLPAWTPDGNKIAFVSIRDENGELCVMDPDGSNVQQLTHTKGKNIDNSYAAWSPDGKKIVFHSNREGTSEKLDYNELEIYVMDADGSNVKRLTFNDKFDAHPNW